MTYKGYSATLDLDEDSDVIFGTVNLVRDMVTFQGSTASEVARAFRDSIDDYLAMMAQHGREPERPPIEPFVERS